MSKCTKELEILKPLESLICLECTGQGGTEDVVCPCCNGRGEHLKIPVPERQK